MQSLPQAAPTQGSVASAATAKPAPGSPLADSVACLGGLMTSLLTGVLLWFVAIRFHFAFHKMTLWFVIPAGAFLSGWVAASGYYFVYQLYRRRPGRLLVPNVIAAAVGSFLLIHYLSYLTFRSAFGAIAPGFLSFLDMSIRSTTIRFMQTGTTPALGYFGYVTTALEVLGFAVGGLSVCAYLRSKNYCDRCSWRLGMKGTQVRYAARKEETVAMAAAVTSALKQGDVALAIKQHTAYGSFARYPNSPIRSVCTVYVCKHCGQNTAVFALQRPHGESWFPIRESVIFAHTDSPTEISR